MRSLCLTDLYSKPDSSSGKSLVFSEPQVSFSREFMALAFLGCLDNERDKTECLGQSLVLTVTPVEVYQMLAPSSPPTPPLGISFLLSQPPFLFSVYLFIFLTYQVACRFLVPQQRIEPMPPLVEVQSLNHWTTREGPHPPFVNIQALCQDMSASSYSFISLQVNLLCHHQ